MKPTEPNHRPGSPDPTEPNDPAGSHDPTEPNHRPGSPDQAERPEQSEQPAESAHQPLGAQEAQAIPETENAQGAERDQSANEQVKRAAGAKQDPKAQGLPKTEAPQSTKQCSEPGETSESEQLLFGGPLRRETGWNHHDGSFLELNLRSMITRTPRLIAAAVRLAHRADPTALRQVAVAELAGGIAQAVGLVAVNQVLVHLLGSGGTSEKLAAALPAFAAVAFAALIVALMKSASTAGTGQLEPKVFRVATEQYLQRVARVELAAVEDEEFHKLLDSAQWGAESARRMIKFCTSVTASAISLIAAAGVLTVLHPALLPLLALMTLPSAWSSLTIARRRYLSFHTWVQHARAGRLLSTLLIDAQAAPEVRVHNIGAFLLRHFRTMAETGEQEQTRLARLAARTGLIASGWTGLASSATYATLGLLLWSGTMDLAVAGTAVIAIRTGSANLESLVVQLNYLYEESLFVADLERLCKEADARLIPETGKPLPANPSAIRFENVSFTYPGVAERPALDSVNVTIPSGRIIAIVGNNGSGKSTLAKLLCGLYVPDSGRITWDDVDAAEADRAQLFDRVAVVAQDFYRWPFTARINVAIGRPDAPHDEPLLDAAAEYAGADETISSLPRGWDTLLARGYKGGHQISGGQWQRIGIARARHRNARVLVVDEPTSALDAEAEQRVFDQIRRLAAEGQTVVLITHRLHSVRHTDEIYVMEQGRIIERGTFDELMRPQEGAFRRMYLTQSRQYHFEGEESVSLPGQPEQAEQGAR